jgi:hypothetical protein
MLALFNVFSLFSFNFFLTFKTIKLFCLKGLHVGNVLKV